MRRERVVTIVGVTFSSHHAVAYASAHNTQANSTSNLSDQYNWQRKSVAMGIKHLYQLIEEHAPEAVKKGEIKNQFGRKVAIVRLLSSHLCGQLLTYSGCVCIF